MRSIKLKLTIAFAVAIVVPILMITFISVVVSRNRVIINYRVQVEKELDQVDNVFITYFNSMKENMIMLANHEALKGAGDKLTSYKDTTEPTEMTPYETGGIELEIFNILRLATESHPDYESIIYGTKDSGFIMFPARTRGAGYDPLVRGWYNKAIKTPGKPSIANAELSSDRQFIDIGASMTVNDMEGNFIGVVNCSITLNRLTELVKEISIGANGYVILVERQESGEVILADPTNKDNLFMELNKIELYKDLLNIDPVTHSVRTMINREEYIVVKIPSKELNFDYYAFINLDEIVAPIYSQITIAAICALVLIIIFGGAAYLFSRSISRPISHISDVLSAISRGNGDLTVELEVNSGDELGRMAESFNGFTGSLSGIISNVKESTAKLSDIGEELSANMLETSSALNEITATIGSAKRVIADQKSCVGSTVGLVEQTTSSINSLNSLIERQSAQVYQSSSSLEHMVSKIDLVNHNIERLNKLYEELTASSDEGKKKISNVNTRIADIEKQSQNLLETNKVIADIAERTNLLSMNAAIEAAHAGESGKGFAVVAGEIRKLAETASQQSRETDNRLKKINDLIHQVVEASGEASEGFNSMIELILELTEYEEEITKAMREQLQDSHEIISSLGGIKEVTEEVEKSSQRMKKGNSDIIREVEKLTGLSEEVLASIDEISLGTKEVNKAGSEIARMSLDNKAIIEKVNELVAIFKLKG